MSEVERYWIDPSRLVQEGWHQDDTCVVKDWAYDRVVAERDSLQALLTAADERADVLEGLLREAMPALDLAASAFKSAMPVRSKVRAALKPAEDRNEPNCLRCLDKKTVPSNLAEGYVMDCPDCCGEEG